tara:strand:+ start:1159 stop:1302 length:144 start_codon:yes stop_codon:yes gene_type:complete
MRYIFIVAFLLSGCATRPEAFDPCPDLPGYTGCFFVDYPEYAREAKI